MAAIQAWVATKLSQPDFTFVGSCQQAGTMDPSPFGRWCWGQLPTAAGDDATYSAGLYATGGGFMFHLRQNGTWTIVRVQSCNEMGCQEVPMGSAVQ